MPFIKTHNNVRLDAENILNSNPEMVERIANILNLTFITTSDHIGNLCYANNSGDLQDAYKETFNRSDILAFIQAVFFSAKFNERHYWKYDDGDMKVPYPKDRDTFWKLVQISKQIKQSIELKSPYNQDFSSQFPIIGDNLIRDPKFQSDQIYINNSQYFSNVLPSTWAFTIDGIQPAQKWLLDRVNHKLEPDDVIHYQKIIKTISETKRLIKKINNFEFD